jgi:hypothetical protein
MTTPTNTAELIRQRIEEIPIGEPFTPAEFLAFGTRAAVDQTLSRLVKAELIMRVIRGVFVRPKINPFIGKVNPSPLKIAELITKGDTIQVHGAEAVRRMELSTQVPMRPIYLIPGPSRVFYLGKLKVTMRQTSRRKLLLAGRPAGIALTAMWYLGKREVTPTLVGKILRKIGAEEFEALKSVINLMPAWMREAMLENEKMVENARVSENQLRFLEVAKANGKEMEPVGRMAGVRD